MGDVAPVTIPNALVDVFTLGAGGIVLLIFVTVVTPTRRGFYCEDESIRYPVKGSTVPNYLLYIYGFIIPFVVILATEFVVNRRSRHSAHFLFRPVPKWFLCMYRSIIYFIFGVVASQLVTDIGKYTIGRLRPNFISVCQPPEIDFSNCSKYNHAYIEEYTCKDEALANLSRVSFPSGHSSFSAYTMLYCAIFIQVKWTIGRSNVFRLVKHAVQLLCILLAYFTALSRVMDNKHHWSDVTAGALIGVISAALTARYVSYLLPPAATASSALYRVDSRENNCQGNDMMPADIEAPSPSRPPREQSVTTPNRPI